MFGIKTRKRIKELEAQVAKIDDLLECLMILTDKVKEIKITNEEQFAKAAFQREILSKDIDINTDAIKKMLGNTLTMPLPQDTINDVKLARIRKLEEQVKELTEFYNYMKGYNCCGYQD